MFSIKCINCIHDKWIYWTFQIHLAFNVISQEHIQVAYKITSIIIWNMFPYFFFKRINKYFCKYKTNLEAVWN